MESPEATTAAAVGRHMLVVQLQDRPGALYRAVGLVRRRDYNVSSLLVGAGESAGTSRMVLVIEAADVRRVVQQLTRLVDVVSVAEIAPDAEDLRETVLAFVALHDDEDDVMHSVESFAVRATHRAHDRLLLELTDVPSRIDEFVDAMRSFDLRQLARTGPIVMSGFHPFATSARPISGGAIPAAFSSLDPLPAQEFSR